jgi:hypothetical protein
LGEIITHLHTHHVATQGATITLASAATLNHVCVGTLSTAALAAPRIAIAPTATAAPATLFVVRLRLLGLWLSRRWSGVADLGFAVRLHTTLVWRVRQFNIIGRVRGLALTL